MPADLPPRVCEPPSGYRTAGPAPAIDPPARLVARADSIEVGRSAPTVQRLLDTAGLDDLLPRSSRLPGVVAVRDLTGGGFGLPGSRRLVCLSDGSVALEQVVERIDNQRFRYIVWNYTSKSARAVRYGVGEFRYTRLQGGRTRVDWTYSFRLDEHRFPGVLGPLGPPLLRWAFLDRAYADLMRGTLAAMKAYVEARSPAGS